MIETIEKIRTGKLPFVEDEEKKEEAKVEEVKEEQDSEQQPAAENAENNQNIEVQEDSILPDFVDALTQTERLTNEVANDFFKRNAPERITTEKYT